MPYSLHQYAPPTSPDSDTFLRGIKTGSVSQSCLQSSYLPFHHEHMQLSTSSQPQQSQLSPSVSIGSSFSSPPSSLSSPNLPSSSSSSSSPRSLSSLAPSTIYPFASTSSTPPPRIVPFAAFGSDIDGASNQSDCRMSRHKERSAEESDVYPLDLSVRSAIHTSVKEQGDPLHEHPQQRPLVSRQRPPSRTDSRYKHVLFSKNCGSSSHHNGCSQAVPCSSGTSSSRAQQRLSPYPVPLLAGGASHSPSSAVPSRSPVPLQTDSPMYGRRRTPSPAYYSGLITDGGYRASAAVNGMMTHSHQQQHYLPPAPPPPPHLAPSLSDAMQQPENSSSPSPFQVLTSSDTVLHGTPIVGGIFRPYQDQVDSEMNGGGLGRQVHSDDESQAQHLKQHQNHDPRRQHLRQLQQQQQQQQQQEQHQNHLSQPQHEQQDEEEEEERTYMDLDCHSQASHPLYPSSEDQTSTRSLEQTPPPSNSHGTAMDVVSQNNINATLAPSSVLNQQSSMGYGEHNGQASNAQASNARESPTHQKSEPMQKGSIVHESQHYASQPFLASCDPLKKEMIDDQSKFALMQAYASHQHHQQLSVKPEQHAAEPNQFHHPHHHRRIKPIAKVGFLDSDVPNDNKNPNTKDVSHEVQEEAKLMAFLSKTTLITVKHEGEISSVSSTGGPNSRDHHQKGYSIDSKIFRDVSGTNSENASSGKMPKIDFCIPQAPARSGPPASCKSSLTAPNKICFRLVDLVGILVEQSLRA